MTKKTISEIAQEIFNETEAPKHTHEFAIDVAEQIYAAFEQSNIFDSVSISPSIRKDGIVNFLFEATSENLVTVQVQCLF